MDASRLAKPQHSTAVADPLEVAGVQPLVPEPDPGVIGGVYQRARDFTHAHGASTVVVTLLWNLMAPVAGVGGNLRGGMRVASLAAIANNLIGTPAYDFAMGVFGGDWLPKQIERAQTESAGLEVPLGRAFERYLNLRYKSENSVARNCKYAVSRDYLTAASQAQHMLRGMISVVAPSFGRSDPETQLAWQASAEMCLQIDDTVNVLAANGIFLEVRSRPPSILRFTHDLAKALMDALLRLAGHTALGDFDQVHGQALRRAFYHLTKLQLLNIASSDPRFFELIPGLFTGNDSLLVASYNAQNAFALQTATLTRMILAHLPDEAVMEEFRRIHRHYNEQPWYFAEDEARTFERIVAYQTTLNEFGTMLELHIEANDPGAVSVQDARRLAIGQQLVNRVLQWRLARSDKRLSMVPSAWQVDEYGSDQIFHQLFLDAVNEPGLGPIGPEISGLVSTPERMLSETDLGDIPWSCAVTAPALAEHTDRIYSATQSKRLDDIAKGMSIWHPEQFDILAVQQEVARVGLLSPELQRLMDSGATDDTTKSLQLTNSLMLPLFGEIAQQDPTFASAYRTHALLTGMCDMIMQRPELKDVAPLTGYPQQKTLPESVQHTIDRAMERVFGGYHEAWRVVRESLKEYWAILYQYMAAASVGLGIVFSCLGKSAFAPATFVLQSGWRVAKSVLRAVCSALASALSESLSLLPPGKALDWLRQQLQGAVTSAARRFQDTVENGVDLGRVMDAVRELARVRATGWLQWAFGPKPAVPADQKSDDEQGQAAEEARDRWYAAAAGWSRWARPVVDQEGKYDDEQPAPEEPPAGRPAASDDADPWNDLFALAVSPWAQKIQEFNQLMQQLYYNWARSDTKENAYMRARSALPSRDSWQAIHLFLGTI